MAIAVGASMTNLTSLVQQSVLFLFGSLLCVAAGCGAAEESGRDGATADPGGGRAATRDPRLEGQLADAEEEEGKGTAPSLPEQKAPYALCNGSDDVRLAIATRGGMSSDSCSAPHGDALLYVTGKCTFVASGSGASDKVEGVLSQEEAVALTEILGLTKLRGRLYRDSYTCPDVGPTSVATVEGYADCMCDCDPGAPREVVSTFEGLGAVRQLVAKLGRPLSGPVEVTARFLNSVQWGPDPHLVDPRVQLWTLQRPLASFVPEGANDVLARRVLSGHDAQQVRDLRAAAYANSKSYGFHAIEDTELYDVGTCDQIEPALEASIQAFDSNLDAKLSR